MVERSHRTTREHCLRGPVRLPAVATTLEYQPVRFRNKGKRDEQRAAARSGRDPSLRSVGLLASRARLTFIMAFFRSSSASKILCEGRVRSANTIRKEKNLQQPVDTNGLIDGPKIVVEIGRLFVLGSTSEMTVQGVVP